MTSVGFFERPAMHVLTVSADTTLGIPGKRVTAPPIIAKYRGTALASPSAPVSHVPVIAFFDLDRTILSINSASVVFRRMRRDGLVPLSDAIVTRLNMALYAWGLQDAGNLIRTGAALSRGLRETDVVDWYEQLWTEEVQGTIRPGARTALEEHRAAGHRLILITSSTPFIARLAARELMLDEALAPGVRTIDGRLTGECEEPLCTGAGKIHHAGLAAERAGARLEDCVFYTDSYSDLPLLEAVGIRVVVDPDSRLRRVAVARHWPVVSWK